MPDPGELTADATAVDKINWRDRKEAVKENNTKHDKNHEEKGQCISSLNTAFEGWVMTQKLRTDKMKRN